MYAFRRAEKLLVCSCVDLFPLLRFRTQVNFGVPKHVGCVHGHNAYDLAEVNMASMDEELFVLILRCRQRNRLNRMRLTLLAHKSRQHRHWVHDILRKRKEFGAYYHLVNELELDKDKYHEHFRMSAEKLGHVLGFVGPEIAKKTVV